MIIIDHGNICVDTIFMILCIIMHSFPDIEEIMFFDNGSLHLHTHNIYTHIHKTTFFEYENICVDAILEMV